MKKYSTKKLHSAYESKNDKKPFLSVNQLLFTGVDSRDVYNPAAPAMVGFSSIMAGRVEPRENHDSFVYLFQKNNGKWEPIPEWNPIRLEDPFFIHIGNILYLGAVKTQILEDGVSMGWSTVLIDISDMKNPRQVFQGPMGMKDLRFVEYSDGKIGVFTRPQGGAAGRGTCGYLETDSLMALKNDDILNAGLISSPDQDSWEGINQAFLIDDENVGLLGHIAWMEEGNIRHYYAAVSEFSRKTRKKTPWRIIAQRSDFPEGPAKRNDLVDVLFPGGIDLLADRTAKLYVGISDTETWECTIPDPFRGHGYL